VRKNIPKSDIDSDDASNDKLRSRYLQSVMRRSDKSIGSEPSESLPLKLIQYWDESDIPPDVQRCLDSWLVTESLGFERLIFNKQQARAFIEDHYNVSHLLAFDSCTHPAMRSDYFRLCYLLQNGGLYVDADDELKEPAAILYLTRNSRLKLQPLCYQLSTDSMVVPADHVGDTTDDFIFYANNDPIFAPVNHPVLDAALVQATKRLVAANGASRDIQWLAGPGNLSEVLVRHALLMEKSDVQPDFEFVHSWGEIAPGDWNLAYRKDARNWRQWVKGDVSR